LAKVLHVILERVEILAAGASMTRIFSDDASTVMMERAMDLSTRRHALISGNLANVDTPGYKAVDIDFEQELQSAMGQGGLCMEVTNTRHQSTNLDIEGRAVSAPKEVEGLTLRNDLNNVSIDREMAEMATNTLKFSAVAQLISVKFRWLKSAIMEGR
jgi:flagellar basal-body rod protein FlgB